MSTFEAAEAALDQHLNPSPSGDSSPGSTPSGEQTNDSAPEIRQNPEGQSTVMELDKLEKFKFEGREWTPQELKSAYMMQADYTRKTQDVAQERKYYDNLAADLESVRNDPSLTAKFKELYPQKYHGYLSYVAPTNQSQQAEPPHVSPEVANRIEKLENFITQFETKNLEREVDTAFTKLTAKYPMADERVVTATANLALQQGVPLRNREGNVNVEELEKIFKAEHDRTQRAFETHYKQLSDKQKAASAKSRDVSSGGGVPGQAPEKLTFEQATQKAIREISARH